MTAFPNINTAFQDGVQAVRADLRDLGNATIERIGKLPASYSSSTAGAPIIVTPERDGIRPATGSDTVNFGGAKTIGQQIKGARHTVVPVTITTGRATLDMSLGQVFDVTVSANISLGGITLSNPPEDYSELAIRLKQGGSGGYTIAGGTKVSAGFDGSWFEFPNEIVWPTASGGFVFLHCFRFGSAAPRRYVVLPVDRQD